MNFNNYICSCSNILEKGTLYCQYALQILERTLILHLKKYIGKWNNKEIMLMYERGIMTGNRSQCRQGTRSAPFILAVRRKITPLIEITGVGYRSYFQYYHIYLAPVIHLLHNSGSNTFSYYCSLKEFIGTESNVTYYWFLIVFQKKAFPICWVELFCFHILWFILYIASSEIRTIQKI